MRLYDCKAKSWDYSSNFPSYLFSYYGGPNTRRVRAGANYRHVGGVIAYVERVINHHGFRNYTVGNGTAAVIRFVHDISVVRLSNFLPFTNLIRQAPILAQGSVVPGNLWLNQVGWGQRFVSSIIDCIVVNIYCKRERFSVG